MILGLTFPQVKRGGAEGTRTPDPHTARLIQRSIGYFWTALAFGESYCKHWALDTYAPLAVKG